MHAFNASFVQYSYIYIWDWKNPSNIYQPTSHLSTTTFFSSRDFSVKVTLHLICRIYFTQFSAASQQIEFPVQKWWRISSSTKDLPITDVSSKFSIFQHFGVFVQIVRFQWEQLCDWEYCDGINMIYVIVMLPICHVLNLSNDPIWIAIVPMPNLLYFHCFLRHCIGVNLLHNNNNNCF